MSAVPTSPVVLTYFNGRGRAELIRLMLEVTGTPYTERRITRPLLQELREKGDLLFQQLPLLEIEGMKLIQSGAIVRYLARRNDLYGFSHEEACACDMLADGLCDFKEHFISFAEYFKRQEDRSLFDTKMKEKLIPRYMSVMETALLEGGKTEERAFLIGKKLSYADVALLEVLEFLEEEYPGLIKRDYPSVAAFHESMRGMDRVRNYLGSERRNTSVNNAYIKEVREVLN